MRPYKEETRVIDREMLLVLKMKRPHAKECRMLYTLEMAKKWIPPWRKECSSASTLMLA